MGLVGYERSWSCGRNAGDLCGVLVMVWIVTLSAIFDLARNVTLDDSLR